jgi:hypothetical protein
MLLLNLSGSGSQLKYGILQGIPEIGVQKMSDLEGDDKLDVIFRPPPAVHCQTFFDDIRASRIRQVEKVTAAGARRTGSSLCAARTARKKQG